MLKMKKRFLPVLLTLSTTAGFSAPTLAAEMVEAQMEARIEAEIQAMEQEVYADVYRQLEAQDGLHMMDVYMEILEPKIRAAVEAEYAPAGYSTTAASNTWTQDAPDGGVVTYTMLGNVKVVEDYMDEDTTTKLINKDIPEYDPTTRQVFFKCLVKLTLRAVLPAKNWEDRVGRIIGGVFMSAIFYVDKLPEDSIRDCGGYACVISTSDPSLPTAYTVVVPWRTYSTISVNMTSVIGGDPVFTAAR